MFFSYGTGKLCCSFFGSELGAGSAAQIFANVGWASADCDGTLLRKIAHDSRHRYFVRRRHMKTGQELCTGHKKWVQDVAWMYRQPAQTTEGCTANGTLQQVCRKPHEGRKLAAGMLLYNTLYCIQRRMLMNLNRSRTGSTASSCKYSCILAGWLGGWHWIKTALSSWNS